MTDNTKVTYIFHCGSKEDEMIFREGTEVDYIDQAFDEWLYEHGLGCDELEDMIAEGEAGYYEI